VTDKTPLAIFAFGRLQSILIRVSDRSHRPKHKATLA
jgi:hypothetical protein